ncbi:MAG: SUMF1/EgtB/PvdO family nonheme iron enzyme [Myxococcales bacterium]|nr:SUMF1/EgtB/PvdO family nonheme iron enzyme [Myxococcales bacterium]
MFIVRVFVPATLALAMVSGCYDVVPEEEAFGAETGSDGQTTAEDGSETDVTASGDSAQSTDITAADTTTEDASTTDATTTDAGTDGGNGAEVTGGTDAGGCGTCADDGNPCTTATCDTKTGKCSNNPVKSGKSCGSDKVCVGAKCTAVPAGMVFSPGGDGWLGCSTTKSGDCKQETLPSKKITIKPVFIDRLEVSTKQFQACITAGKCNKPKGAEKPECSMNKKSPKPNHPMNCLPWGHAKAYCSYKGKRLPTEAEWERAARGNCATVSGDCKAETPVYPWGNDVASCSYTMMKNHTGPGCGTNNTAAVGTKAKDKSPIGAMDMGGNVSEWVIDGWDAKALTNWAATNPVVTKGAKHVIKGGHFAADSPDIRSFSRNEGTESPQVGFRCVLDVN